MSFARLTPILPFHLILPDVYPFFPYLFLFLAEINAILTNFRPCRRPFMPILLFSTTLLPLSSLLLLPDFTCFSQNLPEFYSFSGFLPYLSEFPPEITPFHPIFFGMVTCLTHRINILNYRKQ